MDKIMRLWYDEKDKAIEKYKYLIMLDIKKKKDLERFSRGDMFMERYAASVTNLNTDKKFVWHLTQEEDAEMIRRGEINEARREGISQGIEQGIEQGKVKKQVEIAKNLLRLKMSIDDISKATGLSKKEIEKYV